MNAETKKIIHQLRNGYGLSDEDGRALRLAAAELIEDRDAVLLTLWAVLKSAPGAEVRVPAFLLADVDPEGIDIECENDPEGVCYIYRARLGNQS